MRILIPALVLLVAATIWLVRVDVPPPELATEYPEARMLPEVELTDDTGARFRKSDLQDRFTLMFFGFTHCPDICPLSLQVLAAARASLRETAPGAVPDVVLVSVDSERDTPQRLREYLDNFDSQFIGVTAPRSGLDPLLQQFGVTVMRQELAGDNYNMTHNPQVFVIGPNADLIAIMSRAENPATVAQDYLRIRQRYLNGSIGTPPNS